jgi:hypothetical protein
MLKRAVKKDTLLHNMQGTAMSTDGAADGFLAGAANHAQELAREYRGATVEKLSRVHDELAEATLPTADEFSNIPPVSAACRRKLAPDMRRF